MNAFMEMVAAKPKGLRVEPKYLPAIGEVCLASGPNCDNDHGYTWTEITLHWRDDVFCLYGTPGYWPVLEKLEHVLFEPLESSGVDRPMKSIPIAAAKRIAMDYGFDQVVVFARRVGDEPAPAGEHMTTYGVTKVHCDVAAKMGATLQKFMGWGE